MPSNPTTRQEQRRMITFDAIAPDGLSRAGRGREIRSAYACSPSLKALSVTRLSSSA